jgi:hypothetical protein
MEIIGRHTSKFVATATFLQDVHTSKKASMCICGWLASPECWGDSAVHGECYVDHKGEEEGYKGDGSVEHHGTVETLIPQYPSTWDADDEVDDGENDSRGNATHLGNEHRDNDSYEVVRQCAYGHEEDEEAPAAPSTLYITNGLAKMMISCHENHAAVSVGVDMIVVGCPEI